MNEIVLDSDTRARFKALRRSQRGCALPRRCALIAAQQGRVADCQSADGELLKDFQYLLSSPNISKADILLIIVT